MKRIIITGVLAVSGLLAQQPPAAQPQGSIPVAKQPQPKSKGEVEALQTLFGAATPDARIQAAENLITKFADTEFKAIALFFAAASYEQKGDADKMAIYAERTLEADPNNYSAMLMLARNLAQRTREFDLDKEEKLAKAEKYARQAEAALKDAPKPNPSLTDEQWLGAKKELMAQGHEALGMSAMVRKKYDVAIAEFKTATDTPNPDPATLVRLGAACNLAGKYDDAIAALDKVMQQADVLPAVKQFAQAEKVRAMQAKAGAAKPAATPAPAPQVEIKKQ